MFYRFIKFYFLYNVITEGIDLIHLLYTGMCSGSSSKTKEGPPLNSFIPVADSGRSNSCPLLTRLAHFLYHCHIT